MDLDEVKRWVASETDNPYMKHYPALIAEVERLERDRPGYEIRIVFDGPPGPVSGRFVEVETPDGASINAGKWHERTGGLWELRLWACRIHEAAEAQCRAEGHLKEDPWDELCARCGEVL